MASLIDKPHIQPQTSLAGAHHAGRNEGVQLDLQERSPCHGGQLLPVTGQVKAM